MNSTETGRLFTFSQFHGYLNSWSPIRYIICFFYFLCLGIIDPTADPVQISEDAGNGICKLL